MRSPVMPELLRSLYKKALACQNTPALQAVNNSSSTQEPMRAPGPPRSQIPLYVLSKSAIERQAVCTIRSHGTQVAQWDFENKATRTSPRLTYLCLQFPFLGDFLSCDRIEQSANVN